MLNISAWTESFLNAINKTFNDRIWFVGLQGSYARGEATETSDIDMVVILDELTFSDIKAYNSMLDALEHRELICGFISGKNDILSWEPSDLFQFYYDTLPLKGSLDELLSKIDEESVSRAIKTGACNIYHGCVHNMLYEKSDEILKGLYKSATFVIQANVFSETGRYFRHQKNLLNATSADEKEIIKTFLRLKSGETADFNKASESLFSWAKSLILKN